MAAKLKRLEDQVVVIVGASSGVGLATARAMAKRGAKLVLASRDKAALDGVVRELGGDVIACECDVADSQSIQDVADRGVSKDAVKSYSEALRTELDDVGMRVRVSLVDASVPAILAACSRLKKRETVSRNFAPLVASLIVGGLGLAAVSLLGANGSSRASSRRLDRTTAVRNDEYMIH